jgi:hypothetical protein
MALGLPISEEAHCGAVFTCRDGGMPYPLHLTFPKGQCHRHSFSQHLTLPQWLPEGYTQTILTQPTLSE